MDEAAIISLRLAGAAPGQIAEQLGGEESEVREILDGWAAALEPGSEIQRRAIHEARLERMIVALWPRKADPAVAGQIRQLLDRLGELPAGVEASEVVAQATGHETLVERFVAEQCVGSPGTETLAAELWERFEDVYGDDCDRPTRVKFMRDLGMMGFAAKRRHSGRYRQGIRLRPAGDPGALLVFPGGKDDDRQGEAPDVGVDHPPAHLSPAAAAWWVSVVETFDAEEHDRRILSLACEAWDEAQQARAEIAQHGKLTIEVGGNPRAHPAVGIRDQAQRRFGQLVKQLGLDKDAGAGPKTWGVRR